MKKLFLMAVISLSACIGTDILDDIMTTSLSIQTMISTLKVGETFQLEARYLDNVGNPAETTIDWRSNMPSVITVSDDGLVTAISEGEATITAIAEDEASDSITIIATDTTVVVDTNVREANLKTVSSYPLSGSATLIKNDDGSLVLEFSEDFSTTSALPGLYVYLANNVNTINGALEIGMVTQFSGAQSYAISGSDDLFEYEYVLFFCKPFVVPVGNGKLNP